MQNKMKQRNQWQHWHTHSPCSKTKSARGYSLIQCCTQNSHQYILVCTYTRKPRLVSFVPQAAKFWPFAHVQQWALLPYIHRGCGLYGSPHQWWLYMPRLGPHHSLTRCALWILHSTPSLPPDLAHSAALLASVSHSQKMLCHKPPPIAVV